MKFAMASILSIVTLAIFSGCSLVSSIITIDTNIPLFYGYSFEVINSSDYDLEIALNGVRQTWKFRDGSASATLKPGETGVITIRNYSSSYAKANMSVKAWHNGKMIGAAVRSVYVYGNYSQADTWIVENRTITGSSWSW